MYGEETVLWRIVVRKRLPKKCDHGRVSCHVEGQREEQSLLKYTVGVPARAIDGGDMHERVREDKVQFVYSFLQICFTLAGA